MRWAQTGRSADEYWRQTPRTLVQVLRGYEAECRRQSDLAVATGWFAEVFARKKRLKGLKDYLSKPPQRGTGKQRPDELVAALKSVGATVRKVD